ncbi:hypothetical protein Moror_16817 [Moniliophthora roreri MCA 2997]|uniref:Uncharacterized protein n=1 Tax=Moniliophthora roreri (strain MCA 2997) TaxID=1381753 RepID=V2XBC5_MONRO|nr:hypothetical protein Moror_16817 [Moniliophthora roreri MCA 2997]
MDRKQRTSCIFVFSHPQTASNLLFKIMGSYPSLIMKQCPFIYSFIDVFVFDPERSSPRKAPILDEFFPDSGENAGGFRGHTFQKCLDDIQTLIKDAESENKVVMIKEHTVHLINSGVHAANIEEEGQT